MLIINYVVTTKHKVYKRQFIVVVKMTIDEFRPESVREISNLVGKVAEECTSRGFGITGVGTVHIPEYIKKHKEKTREYLKELNQNVKEITGELMRGRAVYNKYKPKVIIYDKNHMYPFLEFVRF